MSNVKYPISNKKRVLGNCPAERDPASQEKLSRGFTLIEIIVVLGILGLLAAATLAALNPVAQLNKGADAKRKADLDSIRKALELYYNDNNKYPTAAQYSANPNVLVNGKYIQAMPEDPNGAKVYTYVSPDTDHFYLYAALDNQNDPQKCTPTSCPNLGGATCGGGTACNYGVSSTNTTP